MLDLRAYRKGVERLNKQLKQEKRRKAKGFERGLIKGGLRIQRRSQILCPVEFGILRSTARTRSEFSGFQTEVIVSYGTDYAVFVHEDLEAHHPIGRAKFLEIAVIEEQKQVRQDVMDEMKRA